MGERHLWSRRVDRSEVSHDRATRQRVQPHRMHRHFADGGPLRVRLGERRRAGGSDDGDGRPRSVIETGTRPSLGLESPVHPLHEVTDVGVAQW